MFNAFEFYKEANEKALESYGKTLLQIKEILDETEFCGKCPGKYEFAKFANHASKLILKLSELEKNLDEKHFKEKSFEELLEENHSLYEEVLPENYKSSYADPEYSAGIFGEDVGRLVSAVYVTIRRYIDHAFKHKIFLMEHYNRLFVELFSYVRKNGINYEEMKEILLKYELDALEIETLYKVKEDYDTSFTYATDIIKNEDHSDLRYLFKYGEYITENDVKTARFLEKFPKEKLDILTAAIASSWASRTIWYISCCF
jgi:hypothetical protein